MRRRAEARGGGMAAGKGRREGGEEEEEEGQALCTSSEARLRCGIAGLSSATPRPSGATTTGPLLPPPATLARRLLAGGLGCLRRAAGRPLHGTLRPASSERGLLRGGAPPGGTERPSAAAATGP